MQQAVLRRSDGVSVEGRSDGAVRDCVWGGCTHEAEAGLGITVRGGRYNATAEVIRSEPKRARSADGTLNRASLQCRERGAQRAVIAPGERGGDKRKVVRLSREARPDVKRN